MKTTVCSRKYPDVAPVRRTSEPRWQAAGRYEEAITEYISARATETPPAGPA